MESGGPAHGVGPLIVRALGIETSCDETGIALHDSERGLLGESLHSQVDLHALYGSGIAAAPLRAVPSNL